MLSPTFSGVAELVTICFKRNPLATRGVSPGAKPGGWAALKLSGWLCALISSVAWPSLARTVSAGISKLRATLGVIR